MLVTVVAQFTAKTTNSEKAIYFLSLMSYLINKLKSQTLFTCRNLIPPWPHFFTVLDIVINSNTYHNCFLV